MKTYRGSLLLLISVLLLAVYAYFFEYRQTQVEQEKKAAQSQLIKLKTEHIDHLVIAPKEGEPIELSRGTQGWKVLKPSKYVGDQGNIEQIIDELVESEAATEVETGPKIDWTLFGLETPVAVITLGAGSGTQRHIQVSEKTNFEGRVYVRPVGEDRVLLADSVWSDAAKRDLFYFRNKDVFTHDIKDITKLSWTSELGTFGLSKKGNSWVSSEHPSWEFDEEEINNLFSDLRQLKAKSIHSEGAPRETKKLGFGDPKLVIEIGIKGGGQWRAKVSETSDHVFYVWASDPDRTVEVEGSELANLFAYSLDSLRDRRSAFKFDVSDVHSFRYEASQGTPQTAVLTDGQWLNKDSKKPLNRGKVQALLKALSSLQVQIFDDSDAPNNGDAPVVLENMAELFDSKGDLLIGIQWGVPYEKSIDGKSEQLIPMRSTKSKGSLISIPAQELQNLDLKSLEKAAEVKDN